MTDASPGTPRLFRDMVAQSRLAMVASDMQRPDRPLVFVNDAFVSMTGYARDAVVGRNCRFLQGPDTDPDTVAHIRETIEAGRDGYFELLNYRRDGTSFWNGLHIGPIENEGGTQSLYFGAQRDVTRDVLAREAETMRAREMAHRMGNLLAIVSMMVRSSSMGHGEQALRDALEGRLRALSQSNALVSPLPHRDGEGGGATVPLRTVLRTVLSPIATDGRFAMAGPTVHIAQGEITNMALVIHELATNALKHGALSNEAGRVSVDWRTENGRVLVDWTEHGGPPVKEPTRPGMGSRLLRTIAARSKRTDAATEYHPDGLRYRFDTEGG